MNEHLETVLLPAVTLLLGWWLSEVSTRRKARNERRAVIGRTLQLLLEQRRSAVLAVAMLEGLNASSAPGRPSGKRLQRFIQKHVVPKVPSSNSVESMARDLAAYLPTLAYDLRTNHSSFVDIVSGVNFNVLDGSEVAVGTTAELMEFTLRHQVRWLTKRCRLLAWRHSIGELVSLCLLFRRTRRENQLGSEWGKASKSLSDAIQREFAIGNADDLGSDGKPMSPAASQVGSAS